MQLNPECIRDILLFAENKCTTKTKWRVNVNQALPKELSKYSNGEFSYHLRQCILHGYFYDVVQQGSNKEYISITDLSPKGHEFISYIRDKDDWKKTLLKAGKTSLDFIFDVAKEIAIVKIFG